MIYLKKIRKKIIKLLQNINNNKYKLKNMSYSTIRNRIEY